MQPSNKLTSLRKKVENVDKKIIKLLIERFRLTQQIQDIKRESGLPLLQKKREQTLLKSHLLLAKQHSLDRSLVKEIFSLVFSYAKKTGIIKR